MFFSNYNEDIKLRRNTQWVDGRKAVRVMDVAFIGKLIICILSFVQVGVCVCLWYATRPEKKHKKAKTSDKESDDRRDSLDN